MDRSDDPGGVELRFSILSIYARGLPLVIVRHDTDRASYDSSGKPLSNIRYIVFSLHAQSGKTAVSVELII